MIDFEYLTNPEKYHTVPPRGEGEKDEQYKARLKAYVQGIESQQAKIDEVNEVANGWKDEYRIMSLRYERSKKRIDELQGRIDAIHDIIKKAKKLKSGNYLINEIDTVLEGNKDEN